MCATLLGNCDICLCCCALQRLRSHPSASASKRGRYIGQQPTRANQTHWWLFNQSPQRCGTRKNKPECVLAKVVYLTLEASSEPWNLMSGEQIRLSLSSSPCVSVLVLPLEQQQRETSALHLTTETRYWKTIVQLAVQHSVTSAPSFIVFFPAAALVWANHRCYSVNLSSPFSAVSVWKVNWKEGRGRGREGGGLLATALLSCVGILKKNAITSALPHNCVMIANHLLHCSLMVAMNMRKELLEECQITRLMAQMAVSWSANHF